jgi:two-component system cell cycle sensor histidine kinase/response regulator CckA
VGDIRGGISVSAPLHRFLDAGRDQRRPLILAHLTIALLGLVGLVLAARLLDRARAREQRAVALQQRLERELDEARRLEAIGRLGGGVAHEFNNHLAVIGTYTELIASELPPGSDLRDDVSQIRKACSEAAALVERLLASGQRSRVERIETDLDQVVARDVATAVATCPDGIRVAHVPSDTPGLVWGDEEKLGEMLRALIANAVEACGGEGTVQIRTTIDTEPGGELSSAASERPPAWGLLVVQDDGCGMTAEVLDRAFEPFFTTKGAASGRGMGLAVVRGLVRQLGGAIGIESSEGRGTMVSVRLPLAQPNHEPSTPRTDRSTSAEPSSATVLLVEDRPELLRVCERVLTRAGYRVLASASGEDALRRFEFEGAKVSLLLTDVSMPGMSGPELATRIRTLAPDLPVLFTSGDASDAGLADQLGEEASYLRKPFDHGRLIAAVEGVLGRRGSASMRIGPRDGEPPGQSKKAAVAPELDPSLLASMEQAALEGDATGLRAFIVERVEPVAPSLAQALSRRVDDYDYDGVLDLIQRCSDIRATGDEDERE